MDQTIDRHLERMAALGQADRRNGSYPRWLLTELGMVELHVPRTRTFSALKVVRAYARRAKDIDRMTLACFVLGLSTRKVATALLPVLGRRSAPRGDPVGARSPNPSLVAARGERRGQAAGLPGRVGERGPNPALTGQSVAVTNREGLVVGMQGHPGKSGACPQAGQRPDPGDGQT